MSSRLSCNQTAVITIGGSAVWWMLYEVKAGVVYFAAYKLCDLCLSASEASFSQWGAKQIQLPLPFFSFITDTFNTVNNIMPFTPHDMIKCHKWIHVKIRYIYTSVHDMSPVSVSDTRDMYPSLHVSYTFYNTLPCVGGSYWSDGLNALSGIR